MDRLRFFSPLRHRDFRLFWFGLLLSSVGSQFTTVAMAWQIYELTNSPLQIGLIGLVRALPQVAMLLFGGLLADAMDRRKLMMVTQGSLFLVSGTLAVLTLPNMSRRLRFMASRFFSRCLVRWRRRRAMLSLPILCQPRICRGQWRCRAAKGKSPQSAVLRSLVWRWRLPVPRCAMLSMRFLGLLCSPRWRSSVLIFPNGAVGARYPSARCGRDFASSGATASSFLS